MRDATRGRRGRRVTVSRRLVGLRHSVGRIGARRQTVRRIRARRHAVGRGRAGGQVLRRFRAGRLVGRILAGRREIARMCGRIVVAFDARVRGGVDCRSRRVARVVTGRERHHDGDHHEPDDHEHDGHERAATARHGHLRRRRLQRRLHAADHLRGRPVGLRGACLGFLGRTRVDEGRAGALDDAGIRLAGLGRVHPPRRLEADAVTEGLERPRERGHVLEAIVTLAGERLEHHVAELVGQLRAQILGRAHVAGEDLEQERVQAPRPIGELPHQHLVEDEPERVEVAARVERHLLSELLGRHVTRCAHDRARVGERRLAVLLPEGLGHPEVEHLRVVGRPVDVAEDEEVLRLEVAMEDPRLVRGRHAGQRRHQELHRLGRLERSFVEHLPEALALEVVHHEEDRAVVIADVEHAHHVRMREPSHRPRFAEKTLAALRVVFEEPLHGHRAARDAMTGAIDNTHPAAAERLLDLVLVTDEGPRLRLRCVHRTGGSLPPADSLVLPRGGSTDNIQHTPTFVRNLSSPGWEESSGEPDTRRPKAWIETSRRRASLAPPPWHFDCQTRRSCPPRSRRPIARGLIESAAAPLGRASEGLSCPNPHHDSTPERSAAGRAIVLSSGSCACASGWCRCSGPSPSPSPSSKIRSGGAWSSRWWSASSSRSPSRSSCACGARARTRSSSR